MSGQSVAARSAPQSILCVCPQGSRCGVHIPGIPGGSWCSVGLSDRRETSDFRKGGSEQSCRRARASCKTWLQEKKTQLRGGSPGAGRWSLQAGLLCGGRERDEERVNMWVPS
ncbi:uncharacterized protein ACIB01_016455 [Guaruba guarouba]